MEGGEIAIARALELDHPHCQAVGLLWKGIFHYWRREMTEARDVAARAIAISATHGFMHWVGVASAFRGAARQALGEDEDARAEAMAGLTPAVRSHQGAAPFLFGALADVHRAAGEIDEALDAIAQGMAVAEMTSQPVWTPEIYRVKGEILRERKGSRDAAETLFRQALDAATAVAARALAPRAATSWASLPQREGDVAGARAVLRPLHDGFTQGLGTLDFVEAGALLRERASSRWSPKPT